MKPLGMQIVGELVYCSEELLQSAKKIEKILKAGIKECGLSLVSINSHQFDPMGVTAFAIISESHIAIHTYPEARHASIDIFTCTGTDKAPKKLLKYLKKAFKAKSVRSFIVQRGNPMDIIRKDWVESFASYGFAIRYHSLKRYVSKKSKFQKIDIIENDSFGRILFLDNDIQVASSDVHLYNQAMVGPIVSAKEKLNKVAILGGGDGGVLNELLKYSPEQAVLIDIDEDVVKYSKKFLPSICGDAFDHENVTVIHDDANAQLDKMQNFDAIIYDLTMHPEAIINVDRKIFLSEIFGRIRKALKDDGVVTAQCCSQFDHETIKLVRQILSKNFKEIRFRSVKIPSFCESWVFMSAKVKAPNEATETTHDDFVDESAIEDEADLLEMVGQSL